MPISRRRPPLPLRTSREPRPWLTAYVELPVGPMSCVIDGPIRGRPWSSAAVRSGLHRCYRTRPAVDPSWNAASALLGWTTSIPSRVLLCTKSRRATGARRRNRFGRDTVIHAHARCAPGFAGEGACSAQRDTGANWQARPPGAARLSATARPGTWPWLANDVSQIDRRGARRAGGTPGSPLGTGVVYPALQVIADEPERTFGSADADRGDAACLGGIVEPRS
jgi:hypothetical protein